ncbi:MAG: bile acid:sodium symporter family protein [Bacteroidales bacterium]|jgi:BASS family bile acid:Na+ symporter
MKNKLHRVLLIVSALFIIMSGISYLSGNASVTGLFLIAGFISLSIAVRGFQKFKGFSYTLWIFTAVIASMFYPRYFISAGDFQLKKLIVPLLQIIMFGMGSQMSFKDFTGVIKMPRGVFVGVFSHYIIMPLVGFCIAGLFNFPPEISAGIILIGCVPSGLASNVMSFLARANLALAVTIGAISTMLSPLVTPLLMKWLGGQYIEVKFWSMMLDILNMIILPVVAGFIFNLFSKGKETRKSMTIQLVSYTLIILFTTLVYVKSKDTGMSSFIVQFAKSMGWFFFLPMIGAKILSYFIKGDNKYLEKLLSLISMVGIAVIVSIITAAGHDSLLKVGALLLVTSLLHNIAGYTLGYGLSWLAGMPEKDRRTIAFEVGMQNGGLASGLALQMGKVATVGLAPAIFGPLMNVTGSVLANFWRGKPAGEELPK